MKNGIKAVRISCPRTSNYGIFRQKYYKNIEECIKDAKNIYSKMVRLSMKNDKYKDIFFVVGASQTKGDTAQKIKINTKGRPKYVVHGKKVKPHLHIACYSFWAPSFSSEIMKKLNKNIYKSPNDYINRGYKHRFLYTIQKLNNDINDLYFIPYVWRQSEVFLSHGNNIFKKLKDADFIAYEEI